MKLSRIIGRIISFSIICILVAGLIHMEETKRNNMGREEFLAKQAERYDKHYAHPAPIVFDLLGCTVMAVPLFGFYEGLALVLSLALKGIDDESGVRPV